MQTSRDTRRAAWARLRKTLADRVAGRPAPARSRDAGDVFSAQVLAEWLHDPLEGEESRWLLPGDWNEPIYRQATRPTRHATHSHNGLAACLDGLAEFL